MERTFQVLPSTAKYAGGMPVGVGVADGVIEGVTDGLAVMEGVGDCETRAESDRMLDLIVQNA